jgi:hypothetical protein
MRFPTMPQACGRNIAAIAVLLASGPALAHHGRDFLLARSAALPHAGEIYFIPAAAYVKEEDGHEETELEPSLLWGTSDWLAVELHGHAARHEGESFEYESTAPTLHFRYAPGAASAWALGLSLEYEFARDHDESDVVKTLAGFTTRAYDGLVAINLIAEDARDDGEGAEYGYAAGFRWPVQPQLAVGLEAQGDLEGRAEHEALLGVYWTATDRLTLNLGYGAGIDNGPDYTLRTSLIWQLR